jgi:hypothetical protein
MIQPSMRRCTQLAAASILGIAGAALAGAALAVAALGPTPRPADPCAPLETAGRTVLVSSVEELESSVRAARAGDTILVADGRYRLRSMLDIGAPDVTLRGRSGDRTRVVLHGGGMTADDVGVAVSVSAPGVTLADLTIRDVRFHAVQVRGERGASRFSLYRSALMDTGQQLLKGSVSRQRIYADDGLVACSTFSYSSSAPSDYTNGVDILAAKGWTIRDNLFERIRGPASQRFAAGPAILAWAASADTVVERNLILDSYRGIALGLLASPNELARSGERVYDHAGGVIRNNVVVNLNSWADEGIEVTAARDVHIEHNTVLVEGSLPWSISVRFPATSAVVTNNLTNRQVRRRDGGQAKTLGNVTNATREFFHDPLAADLHLRPGTAAGAAGVPLADAAEDFDRMPRPTDRAPDAGAFQASASSSR